MGQLRPSPALRLARTKKAGFWYQHPARICDRASRKHSHLSRFWVERANPRLIGKFDLPDPLADPLQDIRIKSATAKAYFVKAGEYIQILDVDGRQCTDFQCFDARKLDKGIERALDVTTSRTFMGRDFSMPGLHSKYYDQDWTPLIEVVQDTVGRHDAFAMACAAKYYDDMAIPVTPIAQTISMAPSRPMAFRQGPVGWL